MGLWEVVFSATVVAALVAGAVAIYNGRKDRQQRADFRSDDRREQRMSSARATWDSIFSVIQEMEVFNNDQQYMAPGVDGRVLDLKSRASELIEVARRNGLNRKALASAEGAIRAFDDLVDASLDHDDAKMSDAASRFVANRRDDNSRARKWPTES